MIFPLGVWVSVQFSGPGESRGLVTGFGGNSEGETPLPIPNREVKPLSADGTWLERARESRSPPVCLIPRAAPPGRLVVVEAEATLATRARRRWRKPAGSGAWRRGTESPTATAVA